MKERGAEHHRDFSKNPIKSHMAKHLEEDHLGQEKANHLFNVVRQCRSSFERQVREFVTIGRLRREVERLRTSSRSSTGAGSPAFRWRQGQRKMKSMRKS